MQANKLKNVHETPLRAPKITLLTCFFFAFVTSSKSIATPEYLNQFKAAYNRQEATCKTCHSDPPRRNDYGKAVQRALENTTDGSLTLKVLQTIEKEDSDGDGIINLTEISAGSQPGDPNSKPTSVSLVDNLLPKHSLHPAIIHFPIALITLAAIFEIIGTIKNRKRSDEIENLSLYHNASTLNLGFGVLLAYGSIITGIAAWLRMGFTLEGNLLFHLILASTSAVLGTFAYLQRNRSSYLALVLLSGIIILIAGHLGGLMVHGS
ncbi:MAG: hypothetical protein NTU72_05050 [Fimbriimonadales bacterium]|nr:hypothetical protein [Fimbriimonadales bacterium]